MLIKDAVEEYLGARRGSLTHDTHTWYAYHLDTFTRWCSDHKTTDLKEITELATWTICSDG